MDNQGIFAWALASAGLMLIGAFGPWAKVLGVSANGTDGHNDGWLVVAVALLAALLLYARRTSRAAGLWAVLLGVAGAAITLYDRHQVTSAISQSGALGQVLAQVGWGLNLATLASVSLVISGLASFAKTSEASRATSTDAARVPVLTTPTVPAAPIVPAGWYRDPNDPSMLRYWTGSGWTAQTAKLAG